MLLPFSLPSSAFVQSTGIQSLLTGFSIKHSSTAVQLAVQFSTNGVVQDMADPIAPIFELKDVGNYNENPVAKVASYTKTGSGTTATYTLLLNVDTEAIRTALGIDGSGPQQDSVVYNGELQVTDANGAQWKSQTLSVTVLNDVVKDGDTDPVAVTPLKGTLALASGANYVTITGLDLPSTPKVLATVHKPLATATGIYTRTAQPVANDGPTIEGTYYKFVVALTGAANEVLIGASLAASLANLKGAINAETTGGQVAGTTYGTGTTANAYVSAKIIGSTLVAVAKAPGTTGNAITTTNTGSNASWGATTLAGGVGGATGGLNLFATVRDESPDGFTADISAETDMAGYSLNYALLL